LARKNAEDFNLLDCTKGILFFGTPHFGSAWAVLHSKVLRLRGMFKPTTYHIAKLLSKSSAYLEQLHDDFNAVRGRMAIICFFEELVIKATVGVVSPTRSGRSRKKI
jgi:hypothetical protein